VNFSELTVAIGAQPAGHGKPLSRANLANFYKDFVRNAKSAQKNWPPAVLKARYTGLAKKGNNASFEFVKIPKGQVTAFSAVAAKYPKNPKATKLQAVQTLSVPPLFKALARKDENWLQSLAVSLHLPHTHLALHPYLGIPLIEVGHMQSNMKLRKAEIDGLYMGTVKGTGVVLLTMEVKGGSDDILESQVLEQIEAIRSLKTVQTFVNGICPIKTNILIIPMALKLVDRACITKVPGASTFGAVGRKLIYLVDYQSLPYYGVKPTSLTPHGETLFDLRPPIQGVNV